MAAFDMPLGDYLRGHTVQHLFWDYHIPRDTYIHIYIYIYIYMYIYIYTYILMGGVIFQTAAGCLGTVDAPRNSSWGGHRGFSRCSCDIPVASGAGLSSFDLPGLW